MISMPELNERYIGQRGLGATLNGKRISTSSKIEQADAIIYINEGDRLSRYEPEVFARLLKLGHTRRFAHDCYPHALLASGQVDVVVDYDLQPFDYLPLAGVVEEAGGVISDWHGNPLTYESDGRVISAATPELHKEMAALLRMEGRD